MSYGGYGPGNNDPFADVGGFGPGYGAPGASQGPGGPFPPAQGPGSQHQGYPQQQGYSQWPGSNVPGPYGGPPGGSQSPQEPENDSRLFGMIGIGLGLLGFVLAFVEPIYILGAVFAVIGVIFSIGSLVKEPASKGFAITGLVAGFAGLAVAGVWMFIALLSS